MWSDNIKDWTHGWTHGCQLTTSSTQLWTALNGKSGGHFTSSIQMTNCLSQRIHDYDMTSMFAIINRGIGGEPGPRVNRTITKPKNFASLVSQYQTSTDTSIVDIFHTVDSAANSQAIIYQSYNLPIIVHEQLSLSVITSRF